MVTQITKDGDVIVTSKGEGGKRIQEENSWTSSIIMLINFLFTVVTGRLNCLYAGRGEPIDNLFAGQRKEELECSKESKHMLEEPKNQLQTQYQKTWSKRKKVGPCSALRKLSTNADELEIPTGIPLTQPLKFGAILDSKVTKSTRKKDHLEHLVKWKKRPPEDST